MSTTTDEVLAQKVYFENNMLCVVLLDNRIIQVPVSLFPRLTNATEEQRNNIEFISPDVGIHWPEIDEDISIASLLAPHINIAPGSARFKPYELEKKVKGKSKRKDRAIIKK